MVFPNLKVARQFLLSLLSWPTGASQSRAAAAAAGADFHACSHGDSVGKVAPRLRLVAAGGVDQARVAPERIEQAALQHAALIAEVVAAAESLREYAGGLKSVGGALRIVGGVADPVARIGRTGTPALRLIA